MHEWLRDAKIPRFFSEEARRQISEHTKAKWADREHRAWRLQRQRKAMQSKEYREKMSRIAREVASRPEWKEKQSRAKRGKKRPREVGEKISKAKMGHKVSEETRRKISESLKGGRSSWWKDGRSSERQRFYSSAHWIEQRARILERDNHTCQGCGWTETEAGRVAVHHIIPLSEGVYDAYDYPDELLITLCSVCHTVTELQRGYEKWPVNGRGIHARLDRLMGPRPWRRLSTTGGGDQR